MTATTLSESLAEALALDAPLGERLGAYVRSMRELGSPFAAEYDRVVERLYAAQAGAGAPQVGETMPPFVLPDSQGHLTSLDQLLSAGPTVISFNRGHWCSLCRIELASLVEAEPTIAIRGGKLVSIMPDRQEFVRRLGPEITTRVTMLTDLDNAYALSLGLVVWPGKSLADLMRRRQWRLDLFHGNDAWLLPLPATFVVGGDGRIRARFVDPDYRLRMAVADILDALGPAP